MTTKIKQLKDENGDQFYPQTSTDAIANLSLKTSQIADEAVTTDKIADDAVTTDKVADEAVTSDKIDFTTFLTNVRTWYGSKYAGSTYLMQATKTYPVTFDISSVPNGWTVIGFFNGWCRAEVEKGLIFSVDTDTDEGEDNWETEPGTSRTHAFSCSRAFQKTTNMTQIKCAIRCDSGDFVTGDGRFSFTAIALPSNLGSGTIN